MAIFSAIFYLQLCGVSSWCLEKAALFYCGTTWAFHIIILVWVSLHVHVLRV